LEAEILQKGGNWYSYGEKKIGNGRENVADYLSKNNELYGEIEKKLFSYYQDSNKK
jgi:recombination protein RecA